MERHPRPEKLRHMINLHIFENEYKGLALRAVIEGPDGDTRAETVSWRACVRRAPQPDSQHEAMRDAIWDQQVHFGRSQAGQLVCANANCRRLVHRTNDFQDPAKLNVDHIVPFRVLVRDFVDQRAAGGEPVDPSQPTPLQLSQWEGGGCATAGQIAGFLEHIHSP